MRADLDVERLGNVCDLEPLRDAADPGGVHLDDGGGIGREVLRCPAGREGDMAFSRSAGYRKPVAIMVGEPWVDEAAVATPWAFSLLYGIAPESHSVDNTSFAAAGPLDTDNRASQLEIDYQNLYYPVHKKLMAAGWEPATGLQPSAPTVRVERYRPASDFYLVIYNLGTEQAVSFTVDHMTRPGIDERDVLDVLNDDAPAATDLAQALMGQGNATLPLREVQVLHFTS